MKFSKEWLEDIAQRAKYYDKEEVTWNDSFFDLLLCYASENKEIENIVSFERNKEYPFFVIKSLLGFLSYIHRKNHWNQILSQKVIGELYYDYLEQLCNMSAMILPAFLLLSDKDIIYLELEDVIQLCDTYPIWARKVTEFTLQWYDAMDEMVNRIIKDRKNNSITGLYSMGSDSHNYGRRVFCVEVNHSYQWLYKPRSLKIDCGWKNLCIWFQKETGIEIPYVSVLDYKGYGYTKYIPYNSPTEEEIPLFFYHAGILLCLIYWTQGSDMHYENMIAHGNWSYPIDLEMVTGEKEGFSVFDTAMLKYKKYRDGKVIDDFGAFTNDNSKWFSLPRIDKKVVTALEYQEEVIQGFQKTYDTLMKLKPLKTDFFKTSSPRYLIRPTSYYSALLKRLSLEDTMTDGRKYYRTAKKSLQSSYKSEKILESELKAILRGEIPLFYHKSQTRDLYDFDGIVESDFFANIPGHALQRNLTEEDLQIQIALIRQGLS